VLKYGGASSCRKSAVKAKLGTDVEKKLEEALSNKNWGASSTLLNEIAQLTYD
jgi:hypothetical protein